MNCEKRTRQNGQFTGPSYSPDSMQAIRLCPSLGTPWGSPQEGVALSGHVQHLYTRCPNTSALPNCPAHWQAGENIGPTSVGDAALPIGNGLMKIALVELTHIHIRRHRNLVVAPLENPVLRRGRLIAQAVISVLR